MDIPTELIQSTGNNIPDPLLQIYLNNYFRSSSNGGRRVFNFVE
jgi:hypothetical protein